MLQVPEIVQLCFWTRIIFSETLSVRRKQLATPLSVTNALLRLRRAENDAKTRTCGVLGSRVAVLFASGAGQSVIALFAAFD